jgi:hypothetical protein
VERSPNLLLNELMMISVFLATIIEKYGVWCKNKSNL